MRSWVELQPTLASVTFWRSISWATCSTLSPIIWRSAAGRTPGGGMCWRTARPAGTPRRGCQVKGVTFSHLYPLPKQHHELIQGRFPLRNRLSPLFSDMLQTHVQHFEDRLVIGERTTPFQYFPQRIV